MADDERSTPSTPEPPEPARGDAPPPEQVVPASATQPATGTTPPPPPSPTATRPAPRKRRWLPVFLIIMGGLVVMWIAAGVLFATTTLPPYNAADDFVTDLANNRFQAAADQLCDADQNDPDAAIGTVTRHFRDRDNYFVNPFGVDRDGDVAWVDYSLSNEDTPDNDDDRVTFSLRVVDEDGEWKPCPSL